MPKIIITISALLATDLEGYGVLFTVVDQTTDRNVKTLKNNVSKAFSWSNRATVAYYPCTNA